MARDAWIVGGLFLLLCVVYGLTQQERMHGDGPGLAGFHALPEMSTGYNQFYMACGRALAAVVPRELAGDPTFDLRLLSTLAGALGGAATYCVARGFGARRGAALLAALLTASAPAVWFYSTSVEVHSLHYAMAALGAAVMLHAPWQRVWLGTLLSCAVLPLVFFSHLSGVFLGPGCLVLIVWARVSRCGRPFSRRAYWGAVVPALCLTLVACILVRGRLRYGTWILWDDLVFKQVAIHDNAHFSRRMLVEGWLFPLGLLVPGAIAGLLAGIRARVERLVPISLAILILPSTLYFLWWGLPERGGYALGTAAFYGAAIALALRVPGPAGWAGGVALLALQAAMALVGVHSYDRGYRPRDRVAALEELLPPRTKVGRAGAAKAGTVVSFRELTPRIEVYRDDVKEFLGAPALSQYALAGAPAEDFGRVSLPLFDALVAEGPTVVDLSYLGLVDQPVVRARMPFLGPLEAALREHFEVREVERGDWIFLVLEARP